MGEFGLLAQALPMLNANLSDIFDFGAAFGGVAERLAGYESQGVQLQDMKTVMMDVFGTTAEKVKISLEMYFLIGFWIYYILKLLIDLFYFKLLLNENESVFYYILQTIFIGFFNLLAFYFAGKKINVLFFNKVLLINFFIVNLFLVASIVNRYGFNIMEYANVRVSLVSEKTEIDYLNPITIGLNGAFLLLCLFFLKNFNWYHYFFVLIGLFNLVISASKGPLLALSIVIIITFLFRLKKLKISKLILIIVLCSFIFIYLINSEFLNSFAIYQRIIEEAGDKSESARQIAINNSFEQILDSPVFGTHYFVTKDNSSPHNIIVDVILSTGLIGFSMLIIPYIKYFKTLFQNINNSVIMGFGLITFSIAQTSGYVHGAVEFWAFTGLILAIANRKVIDIKY
jgi:O-antigen ligase